MLYYDDGLEGEWNEVSRARIFYAVPSSLNRGVVKRNQGPHQ